MTYQCPSPRLVTYSIIMYGNIWSTPEPPHAFAQLTPRMCAASESEVRRLRKAGDRSGIDGTPVRHDEPGEMLSPRVNIAPIYLLFTFYKVQAIMLEAGKLTRRD